MTPHHRFHVRARMRSHVVDVAAELSAPWTVLFGPSGVGKSTVLRGLCGLLGPAAHVAFTRGAEDMGVKPTHQRDLSYAPQHVSLFPHLSVARNISFGREACGEPLTHGTLVEEATTLFRVHALSARRPSELSGGEAKRVALARAFAVPECRLLLLDEPFAGMDRKLRDELLPEMMAWCAAHELPVLSVTHDVEEALLLGADVIRVEDGKVVAQGPARDVLSDEQRRMVQVLS